MFPGAIDTVGNLEYFAKYGQIYYTLITGHDKDKVHMLFYSSIIGLSVHLTETYIKSDGIGLTTVSYSASQMRSLRQ